MMNQKKIIIILGVLLGIALLVIAFLLGRDSKPDNFEITEIKTEENKKKEYQEESAVEEPNSNNENIQENKTKDTIPTNKDNIPNVSKSSTSSSNNSTSDTKENDTKVVYSEKDNLVIDEIEQIEENTIQVLNNENKETAKDKAKGVFITLVDFVFYDGKIKGVTFDELTESGKEKVLTLISSLDSKIEDKFPGYKEDISSKASSAFKKASEVIKSGASDVNNFSREKLGDENYNRIIDAKDDLVEYTKKATEIIKNVGGNLFTRAKDKLKNWYEKFKQS